MMVLSVKLQEIRQWYLLVQNVNYSLASNVSRLHLCDLGLFLFIYVRFGFGQLAPVPHWVRCLVEVFVVVAGDREATLAPVSHVQTCPVGMSQVLGVVGGSILLFLSSGLLTSLKPDVRHWCFIYPISISTEVIRVSRQHLKVQGSSSWDGYRVIPWEFPCGHGRGEGPLGHQNSSH